MAAQPSAEAVQLLLVSLPCSMEHQPMPVMEQHPQALHGADQVEARSRHCLHTGDIQQVPGLSGGLLSHTSWKMC
jgi:hypothetical protein